MKTEKRFWNLADIWNSTLEFERRPTKARDYLYASDFGKSYLDIYYNLKGVKPTNPFDDRALRVFAAGYEFQHLVEQVCKVIGIFIEREPKFRIEKEGKLLAVSGRGDIRAGGITDWKEARKRVKGYGFSEGVETRALALIKYFEKEWVKGLEKLLIEVKSVNSLAFWHKKDYIRGGYLHHLLQLYGTLKGLGEKYGKLLYISKDDLCLQEINIIHPQVKLEEEWQKFRREISKFYYSNKRPEREPDIVWGGEKWEKNWKIGRSQYLTKITGFKGYKEWDEVAKKEVGKRNRVIKRIREGNDLTKYNEEVIKVMCGEDKECRVFVKGLMRKK